MTESSVERDDLVMDIVSNVDSYRELERSMKVGVPFVAPHRPKKPGGRDCYCRGGNVPLDTKPPEASPISTGPGRLTN
jgi:hypothetical protein